MNTRYAMRAAACLLGSAAALSAQTALAQVPQPAGYPSRAIRIIVPIGQGGGFDFLGRTVAQKLSERSGQSVFVENRPGAGSLVGTEAAAKAAPDGYTLLVGGLTNMAANVGLYKSLPYDPLADFRPLAMAVSYSFCLVARKDLPQANLKELIDHARANPGKVTYASAGTGTGQHVAAAVLAHLTQTNLSHVPYKGAPPAYQDMLAGRIDLFFDNCGVAKGFVDNGQVRLLAVSGGERSAAMPGTPTVSETGVAKMEMESWIGFYIQSRAPQPITEWLRAEMAAVLNSPDVVQRLERGGGRMMRLSIPETEAFMRAEVAKWRVLIPQAGVNAE